MNFQLTKLYNGEIRKKIKIKEIEMNFCKGKNLEKPNRYIIGEEKGQMKYGEKVEVGVLQVEWNGMHPFPKCNQK